jgi:hypothetical protein
MTEELINRLTNSTAFKSLSTEQQLTTLLASLKWEANQSTYYLDYSTGKYRELDVIASQYWKSSENDKVKVSLKLIIEVKSLSGYHLLFSEAISLPKYSRPRLHYEYIGYLADVPELGMNQKELLLDIVSKSGLKGTEVISFFERFEKALFPDEAIIPYDLAIKPFPDFLKASAFRETNIGGEKELDNSVLWKASQSLRSAVKSIKYDNIHNFHQDLGFVIEWALQTKQDPVNLAIEEAVGRASQLDLFHPIIVVDANLWSVDGLVLQSIESCRFLQVDHRGSIDWWADIVSLSNFPTYIENLTKYYRSSFRKVKAKISLPKR